MSDRFARQTFLGVDAERQIATTRVGVVGLGGGGSQVVQDLAHTGFQNFVLFDADTVEDSNLNRLVGATRSDVPHRVPKLDIAHRMITGLAEDAPEFGGGRQRWQDAPEDLRGCDLVFGCVDSFSERAQLEAVCRRHLIPLIDIGLDITIVEGQAPVMGGQVILSMPGGPCLRCFGILTEESLAREASRYGDAGPRPQVIWGNGALVSAAVGIAMDLVTDWTESLRGPVFLEYRGNANLMKVHPRLEHGGVPLTCPHYPLSNVGASVPRLL